MPEVFYFLSPQGIIVKSGLKTSCDLNKINALDLEGELLLTGFQNLEFIKLHQFLSPSTEMFVWLFTPILPLTQII